MGGFKGSGVVSPGGELPAGVFEGDILFWNGAAWQPNAEGVPDVGAVLFWDGASWVPVVSEPIIAGNFPNQYLVWDGSNWVPDFTFRTSTQTTWSVDTGAGSDANVGTAASPLATYAEFFRRWSTLIVDASVATIAVTFIGDPPAGTPLILDGATFLGPTVVTVSGTMTQTDSGSITAAYQVWNGNVAGADGQRGMMTDAAQDFTASVLRRIRMTSGAANGSVSNVMSLGPGAVVTTAHTGQFCSTTPATTNPANGDTYVIETPDVTFNGWSIHSYGNASFVIRDLEFVAAAPAGFCGSDVRDRNTQLLFFGCRFSSAAAALAINGRDRFAGCSFEGNTTLFEYGSHNILNCCFFGFTQFNSCVVSTFQANAFDGGGTRNAAMFVSNGTWVESIGGTGNFGVAFYGVINGSGTSLLTIQDGGHVVFSNAAANFIGATGNTTTNACQVFNGCFGEAVTLPKANGVAAGTDLVLAGAAAIAWVFASAAPPNNAAFNARA